MIPVDLLAELVETVDQVEDVDLGKVAVWAEVPGEGDFGEEGGVAAEEAGLGAGYGGHFEAFEGEGVPC